MPLAPADKRQEGLLSLLHPVSATPGENKILISAAPSENTTAVSATPSEIQLPRLFTLPILGIACLENKVKTTPWIIIFHQTLSTRSFCTPYFPPNPFAASTCELCFDRSSTCSWPTADYEYQNTFRCSLCWDRQCAKNSLSLRRGIKNCSGFLNLTVIFFWRVRTNMNKKVNKMYLIHSVLLNTKLSTIAIWCFRSYFLSSFKRCIFT